MSDNIPTGFEAEIHPECDKYATFWGYKNLTCMPCRKIYEERSGLNQDSTPRCIRVKSLENIDSFDSKL